MLNRHYLITLCLFLSTFSNLSASNLSSENKKLSLISNISNYKRNYICKKSDLILSLANRLANVGNKLSNNRGEGIIFDASISPGLGAKVEGSLEVISLDNKLSLFCSSGIGMTLGADIGVSLTATGIQTIGCQNPSDYKGYFLKVFLSGAIAPVELGGAVSIGFNPHIFFEKEFLKDVYHLKIKDIQSKKSVTKNTLSLIKNALFSYMKRTGLKMKDALTHLQNEDLMQIVSKFHWKKASWQQDKDFKLMQMIVHQLDKSLTHCNSISMELGLAVKEGMSGGGLLSYYSLIDQTFSFDIKDSRIFHALKGLTKLSCSKKKEEFQILAQSFFKFEYVKLKKLFNFLKNITAIPILCNPAIPNSIL